MDKIRIAVLGLGNVGQGVVRMIDAEKETLARNAGCAIELGRVLEKYMTKKRDVQLPDAMYTSRWEDILHDPTIQVVVETIGGLEPARTYLLQALAAGKNVVTANKDLLAEYGQELFLAAGQAGRDIYFESSVGAAIPVIGALRQNLSACRIREVMGIINGTTNYVLSKMEEGSDFTDALQEAQDLGLTETDPQADTDGYDAARNAAILATLAFHRQVQFSDVFVEGIDAITREEIAIAGDLGYTIKLLALCRSDDQTIEARVHPTLIPQDHPLSGVKGTYNAMFVKGDAFGEMMFSGLGAGRMPSASAILSDVAAVAHNILHDCQGRLNTVENRSLPMLPMEKVQTRYFLRLLLADEAGALAQTAEILGRCRISIARVRQTILDHRSAEVIFITHLALEGDMREALSQIEQLDVTLKVLSLLRVEGEKTVYRDSVR